MAIIPSLMYNEYNLQSYPVYPNPVVSAPVRYSQFGRIRPEKRPFFHIFPHFSQIEPIKKKDPPIEVQYIKLKPMKSFVKCKRKHLVQTKVDKGKPLNLDIFPKFGGNFRKSWGNTAYWTEICGVLRQGTGLPLIMSGTL